MWKYPRVSKPENHELCLITVNGNILPDVFVYLQKTGQFCGQTSIVEKGQRYGCDHLIKEIEVEWWMSFNDIRQPPKLSEAFSSGLIPSLQEQPT